MGRYIITLWTRLIFSKSKRNTRSKPTPIKVRKCTRTLSQLVTAPIEIWLILPVVICLFQGLSHACLRITALQESAHGSLHQTQSAAKMLRKRIIGYLVRNAKLIHEQTGWPPVKRGALHGVPFVRCPANE